MRRNHLMLDLLPMFESLNLGPDARQLNAPGEEICRSQPLTTMLKGRSNGFTILVFKRSNRPALSIEVHRIAFDRKIRQSKDAALFRRHGIERTIDQYGNPF